MLSLGIGLGIGVSLFLYGAAYWWNSRIELGLLGLREIKVLSKYTTPDILPRSKHLVDAMHYLRCAESASDSRVGYASTRLHIIAAKRAISEALAVPQEMEEPRTIKLPLPAPEEKTKQLKLPGVLP